MCSFRSTRLHVAMLLALLAGTLFTPTALKAQDSSAMTGVVTDATGAAIPGAVVTLTNKATAQNFTQTTNATGTYHFLNVPAGPGYVETITHAGFAKVDINDIYLAVGDTRTQNAKLQAGTTAVVSVTASNSEVTLDTTDAAIGSNVDVATLNQLPVQDRTGGITTLFNLQAGVVNTQLDNTDSTISGAVTGARTDQTSVTVDGLDVNDIAAGTTFGIIAASPVDSVEQFTGTVGGLTAGLGTGSGGQFQLVTKHGTNQFHGNINEYHRDTTTTSNTYFNNLVGVPRTPLIRNQFGGNVGGPIVKNKLFFFFDFADSRIIQSGATEPTVPIPALDSSTPTLNYINNGPGCGESSRLNTQANCISSISAAQAAAFDPAGIGFNLPLLAFIAKRYPTPNDPTQGDGVNTEGFRFTYPEPDLNTTYVGRIDYNMTKNNKLYGRFTINRENSVYPVVSLGAPEFPGDPDGLTIVDRSYGYVVSDIWTIGNNKVNQIYYGDNISKLTFPAGDFPTSPNDYSFAGTSPDGLANPYGQDNTQNRRIPIPVVRDDFNWQVKNHSLTMGGLFKFIKTNSNNITNFNIIGVGLQGNAFAPGLPASSQPAGLNGSQVALNDYNGIYALALGAIGETSTNFDYNAAGQQALQGAGNPLGYRYYETEAYFGDTWKVNKQLTISYGLRWQTDSVPYEVHGIQSNYQLVGVSQPQSTFNQFFNDRLEQNATGSLTPTLPFFQAVLAGKANHADPSYAQPYKDFQPRLAFSYNPSFAPKTVFNGSAAIVYDRTVINAINNLQAQLSFLSENAQTNQFPGLAGDPRLGASASGLSLPNTPNLLPTPSPVTPGVIPFGAAGILDENESFDIDPGLKDPYSISLNAGVQQELPFHMVLRVNYVGRLGRRLLADADAGQILNFPDNASGQTLSQAFAGLTGQLRSGAAITPQPWFENVVGFAANNNPNGNPNNQGPCTSPAWNPGGAPFANCTQLVAAEIGQLGTQGNIGGALAEVLAPFGLLPNNVALPDQFFGDAFLGNKGSSNYHALLFSLSKNVSQGLKFDFNYTFSHSIDNNSQAANNNALFNATGVLCDVTKPRACRGDSDFDVRQIISADFSYDLPFGHNREFFGDSGTLVNELIGGWSVSGIPSYRTGVAINVLSNTDLASIVGEDPAIYTGTHSQLSTLKSHINNVQGTVYNFAGGATGATNALNLFRGPLGLEYGSRNLLKGPGAADLDLGLAKIFPIIPSRNINLIFRADAFNILNHPNFDESIPATNIVNNAGIFGQVSSTISPAGQVGDIRVGQFSLRVEF
jgi:hypothetical protein